MLDFLMFAVLVLQVHDCRPYTPFNLLSFFSLIGGRGRSRSLKMAPFDRLYTTYYRSAIASIALSRTIFELFDVK